MQASSARAAVREGRVASASAARAIVRRSLCDASPASLASHCSAVRS